MFTRVCFKLKTPLIKSQMVSLLACPAVCRKRLFLSFDMRNATHKRKTQTWLANLIAKLCFTVEEAIQMVNEHEKKNVSLSLATFQNAISKSKEIEFSQIKLADLKTWKFTASEDAERQVIPLKAGKKKLVQSPGNYLLICNKKPWRYSYHPM